MSTTKKLPGTRDDVLREVSTYESLLLPGTMETAAQRASVSIDSQRPGQPKLDPADLAALVGKWFAGPGAMFARTQKETVAGAVGAAADAGYIRPDRVDEVTAELSASPALHRGTPGDRRAALQRLLKTGHGREHYHPDGKLPTLRETRLRRILGDRFADLPHDVREPLVKRWANDFHDGWGENAIAKDVATRLSDPTIARLVGLHEPLDDKRRFGVFPEREPDSGALKF